MEKARLLLSAARELNGEAITTNPRIAAPHALDPFSFCLFSAAAEITNDCFVLSLA